MQISIPSINGSMLTISDEPNLDSAYPTSRLMKGMVMSIQGADLAEEAVGFGVPVIKRGLKTYFPGTVSLRRTEGDSSQAFTASYLVNLEEQMVQNGHHLESQQTLYWIKNLLAAVIRNFPQLRKPLTDLSSALRSRRGWQTVYVPAKVEDRVDVGFGYRPLDQALDICVDLSHADAKDITEVIMMNELGGAAFDLYQDSEGIFLKGDQIGPWDEVHAECAQFSSSAHRVAFSVGKMPGVKLYRGRELIGQRLAWSGFGYSIPAGMKSFQFTISLDKLP